MPRPSNLAVTNTQCALTLGQPQAITIYDERQKLTRFLDLALIALLRQILGLSFPRHEYVTFMIRYDSEEITGRRHLHRSEQISS